MKIDFEIKFVGTFEKQFSFQVKAYRDYEWDEENPDEWDDLRNYVEVKSDEYLYIQGCKITNDKMSISEIWSNLRYKSGDDIDYGYVSATFFIDSYKKVTCKDYYTASEKGLKSIHKALRFFGVK